MSTNLNLPSNCYKELLSRPLIFNDKNENNTNQDQIINYFDQNLIQYLENLQKNMQDLTIKVQECTTSQDKIFSQLKMVFEKLQEFDSAEYTEQNNNEEDLLQDLEEDIPQGAEEDEEDVDNQESNEEEHIDVEDIEEDDEIDDL